MQNVQMTEEQANKFNGDAAERFARENPWWYGSEHNKAALIEYLDRNSLRIVNAEMLCRAAERIRDFGLLEERPELQLQPEQADEPPPVIVDDGSMKGIDPATGESRRYSAVEIRRMTSSEYLRCFALTKELRTKAWSELDAIARSQNGL